VKHHAALPWREVEAFIIKLRKQAGIGVRALEFAILTAARSGEVRGARWFEVDMEVGQARPHPPGRRRRRPPEGRSSVGEGDRQ
jgi:integrase